MLLDMIIQAASVSILQDNVEIHSLVFKHVLEFDNVWMVERFKQLGFVSRLNTLLKSHVVHVNFLDNPF